jgi:NAD(P)-dependent dehydrogenase (short-subunit alcohol dehydrogenase family)
MKRVALITGGSRGIGLGIAQHLVKAGFDIAINGVRDESAVVEVIQSLKQLGAKVIYCQGSISSANDRKKIIEKVKEKFGHLHVLVNNAGIAPRERKDVLETTEESFDEVVSTNLKGNYFLTQLAANWMIEQKKSDADFVGSIINVSSISATVASVNRGEYCISKAGLSMSTQLFAVRLGEFNIPVFEVRPGIISTDMTSGVKAKYDKLISEGLTVQNRWGFPDDVGSVVAALASGKFPYSTGQVIMVDGGLTIPRL